jgi:uncharacterized protein DUF6084
VSALGFKVVSARPEAHAAAPTLMVGLRVSAADGAEIQSIALYCQIRIEPQRRRYSPAEEDHLHDLFGAPPRWSETLKPFLWTHASMIVPGFTSSTDVELPVPCTYDLEVAAARYFHALGDGEIPLLFLFSGTLFIKSATGLQASQIPWDNEASCRLPVRVWRDLMDGYFPNRGWLRLTRDTLDKLARFKSQRALATWDQTLEALLREAAESANGL